MEVNYSVITMADEAVGVQCLNSFTSVVCSCVCVQLLVFVLLVYCGCWSWWLCLVVGPGLGDGSEDGDEGKDPVEQGAGVGHQ